MCSDSYQRCCFMRECRSLPVPDCGQGELLAPGWDDVSLDRGELWGRRALARGPDGTTFFGKTRTQHSQRAVPLPPGAIEPLRQHQAAQERDRPARGGAWRDHNLVFAWTREAR